VEIIEDGRAPPGVNDPGISLTPKIFREQTRRQLASLLNETTASDALLDSTLLTWERLATRVIVWRHTHRLTLGAVRENDVSAICDLVERDGNNVGQAIQALFPHLSVDSLPDSVTGEAARARGDWTPPPIRPTGRIATPELARQRAHRELTRVIEEFEMAEASDEFCTSLGDALEMEIQVLKSWRALNAKLPGNVDRAYVWTIVNAVRWYHKSAEDAVLLLMLAISKK
jgi:hypothetical protein